MPRPLTHDLIVSLNKAFGIRLIEVYIYKFEDGIFSSELTFDDGSRQIVIDSRTSDAIAIAMRTNAPIYTTRKIIDETGFIMEISNNNTFSLGNKSDNSSEYKINIENLAIEELEKILNKHIEQEEYEEAAKISKIINQKKQNSSSK